MVQYVKICSLYGAGFYYMPGTDTCLKVGGWVRAEYAYGDNGSFAWGWANGNANNRTTNNSSFRARGYITADAREQTEYGTLRSYIAVGVNTSDVGLNTAANTFSANRAFIQFAGFTAGIAQSFYDFYSVPASSFWGAFPASDTGDPGWMVMAYTAQFGNGLSASISAEERRMTQIASAVGNLGTPYVAGAAITAFPGSYGGFQSPDVVANLRLDQAWGSAQVMGAMHQVNPTYYSAAGATANGPSDKWGYVVGAGLKLNAPMFGPGDYFQAQVNYANGASKYVFQTPNSNWYEADGANAGYGVLSDAVYAAGTPGSSMDLTTAWGLNAAYDHHWSTQWKTSLYGGYAAVSYNTTANATLCGLETGSAAGCDNNWSTYWVGSRTQWNITKNLYVGLDVLYSKLKSANPGTGGTFNGRTAEDRDNVGVRFRVHRDFYP